MGTHVMAFDQTLRNYAYNEATTTTGVLNNQSPCIYAFILDTKNGDLKKKKKFLNYLNVEQILIFY